MVNHVYPNADPDGTLTANPKASPTPLPAGRGAASTAPARQRSTGAPGRPPRTAAAPGPHAAGAPPTPPPGLVARSRASSGPPCLHRPTGAQRRNRPATMSSYQIRFSMTASAAHVRGIVITAGCDHKLCSEATAVCGVCSCALVLRWGRGCSAVCAHHDPNPSPSYRRSPDLILRQTQTWP